MKTFKPKFLLVGFALLLSGLVLASFSIVQKPWEVPAKYKTMKNTFKADAASIALGKTLYNKHCKSCHGTKGEGDGPKVINLDVKPRSFLSKEFKAQTPGEIYYKSYVGRGDMPNFEKKIVEEEDRWAVVNYMASLK